ncbi:chymotrypsin-1-like [Cimex lectularius]|uniref:Peptidase S1 domain-containing protein n=1 Tax=Cimex lectularius TaxID=79782 RepID=A0A8I6TFE6_CIMLE|nr:chymotrypsin-1-like [Cimex lectularius]
MIWISMFLAFFLSKVKPENKNETVGWRMAYVGEFPFVVAIGGSKMCAGSLMTLQSVITAGHCIYYDTEHERSRALKYIYIIGGVVKIEARKMLPGRQERHPSSLKVHEKYERRTLTSRMNLFDIGVMYLSKPFKETEVVRPMRLISTSMKEFKRGYQRVIDRQEKCHGVGWHWNLSNSERKLIVIELIPKSNTFCSKFKKSKDEDQSSHGEVCLMPANPHKSNCHCDTGGPLVCKGLTYGVLSTGFECSDTTKPVYYFLFWSYMEYYGIGSSPPRLFHSDLAWKCAMIIFIMRPPFVTLSW